MFVLPDNPVISVLSLLAIGAASVVVAWGVVGAAAVPSRAWRAIDERRSTWVLLQLLMPLLGTLLYLGTVRPRLLDARSGD